MRLHPSLARPLNSEAGRAMSGVVLAVLILAAVGVGAFFYFGGEADVDIKKPDVSVTSSETPS
jgi:hypothetical protein